MIQWFEWMMWIFKKMKTVVKYKLKPNASTLVSTVNDAILCLYICLLRFLITNISIHKPGQALLLTGKVWKAFIVCEKSSMHKPQFTISPSDLQRLYGNFPHKPGLYFRQRAIIRQWPKSRESRCASRRANLLQEAMRCDKKPAGACASAKRQNQ